MTGVLTCVRSSGSEFLHCRLLYSSSYTCMASSQRYRIRVLTVEEYLDGLREGYQSRTLAASNRGRVAYLPVFPTKFLASKEDLLLVNVLGK